MKRTTLLTTFLLAAAAALVVVAAASGRGGPGNNNRNDGGKGRNAAVTVFALHLSPRQEVPPITNLRARGKGLLTLDVTRDSAGAITSGEVVFYVNYDFPGSFNFTGLHVHKAPKGVNGPIVVDSGIAAFTDADGDGNVTSVVAGVSPTLLQEILNKPRDFYVNLHTSVNPGGAMRDQLAGAKRSKDRKHGDDSDD